MEANQPTNLPEQPTIWQLVVARPIEEIKSIIDYIEQNTERYLAQQHDADETIKRTHTHVMLVNYKYSKTALEKCLNKNGIIGSDNYGLMKKCVETKKDYDERILSRYILKGGKYARTTIRSRGYEDSYFGAIENEYVTNGQDNRDGGENENTRPARKRLIQYKLVQENPKEAKIRKNDFVNEVRKRLRERYPDAQRPPGDCDIMLAIREVANEYHEVIGEYKVLDYYDTIVMRDYQGRWLTQMLGLLEKRKPRV